VWTVQDRCRIFILFLSVIPQQKGQQKKVMGHKKICLGCRLSFNRPFDSGSEKKHYCPECGNPMILLAHRFRPPKKSEDKKWETVKFLIENGFYFQHINEIGESENGLINSQNYVKYPDNLRDAKEFVQHYQAQAIK
jgi:predicted RNA-binding Zn-ribbon protein involved in translation (DUF1610 family)